jgi:hypothetical protein
MLVVSYLSQRVNAMKPVLFFAVLGVVFLIPAQAQMRGGMRGGFSGARISSGFRSGPVMPARGFAPRSRAFSVRPGFAPRGIVARSRFTSSGATFRFNPRRARGHVISFPNCIGFPCFPGRHHFFRNSFFFGSPFFGNPFLFGSPFFSPFATAGYIPGFDYPSDYYDQPQQQPVVVQSDNGGDTQLAMEVQRLSDEISDLRGEQALQEIRNRPAPPPGTSMSAVSPAAETTFVFRDGHRLTAENYAITGQTLWILNEHAAKKFAISDLDQAATEQVNSANGVELHLPESAKH